MSERGDTFQYTLTQKADILFVSFSGDLGPASNEDFARTKDEITAIRGVSFYIFHFNGLVQLSPENIKQLTHLQVEARKRPAELRITGLPDVLKERLVKIGVLRSNEICASVNEALLVIQHLIKNRRATASRNAS